MRRKKQKSASLRKRKSSLAFPLPSPGLQPLRHSGNKFCVHRTLFAPRSFYARFSVHRAVFNSSSAGTSFNAGPPRTASTTCGSYRPSLSDRFTRMRAWKGGRLTAENRSATRPSRAPRRRSCTAAAFDVLHWLQVTNNGVLDVAFDPAPRGSNHINVWDWFIHAQNLIAGRHRFSLNRGQNCPLYSSTNHPPLPIQL